MIVLSNERKSEMEMQYLRLDMYINSSETLIGEANVSERGFENLLNATDIIDSRIAEEIRTLGLSSIPVSFRTEELLEMIFEATGKQVESDDEINFCMCLWDDGEHLESAYKLSNIE